MRIRRWGNTINARYEKTDYMNEGLVVCVSDPLLPSDSSCSELRRICSALQISEWQTSIIY